MSTRFRQISMDTNWTFSSRNWACLALAAIFTMLLFSCNWKAAAQASNFDTGTISGIVTDPTGAAIPQAAVTITNTGTGCVTNVKTGNDGSYTVPALPFGTYVVSATAGQFNKNTSNELRLNVGTTVRVDLKLAVAAASESIEVTGTATTVNLSNATSGTTLNETQVENLPTNGRDVMDFLNIAPGSVNSTSFFQGSVNGQENFFTGIDVTLDGQNATRPDISGFDETEGNEANRMTRASVDSIQEIDFANSGYSADVGHSLGPQMNIITKGGTNKYHGELFDFFRNNALDAHDYFFNPVNNPAEPLRMNQFGGNVGGPVVRNKLFFFVNYEGLQQHTTSINNLNGSISQHVRNLMLSGGTAMAGVEKQLAPLTPGCSADPIFTTSTTCDVPTGYEDQVNSVFGAIPNPAGGSDLVYQPTSLPTTVSENSGAARLDYNLGSNDRIFARYTIDDGLTTQTYGTSTGQVSPLKLVNQYGVVDETHTFTPTLVNEASVAIQNFHSDTNSQTPLPNTSAPLSTQNPLVAFAGFFAVLGSLPGAATFNQINDQTIWNIADNATKTYRRHAFKFGAQFQFNRLGEWLRPEQDYEFGNFLGLESDSPFLLQRIGFPGFINVRNSNWDVYAEDDWRVSSRLTFNLGVRIDTNTAWSERNNLQDNFDFQTQAFLPYTQPLYSSPTVDAAPRVGMSYDPFGHGKTVVHAYYGLFYLPLQFGANFVSNNPAYESYSVNVFQASVSYPEANPTLPAGTQNVYIMPNKVHDAYSENWLFGIQQEVAPNTTVTVNYVGNEDQRMQAGQSFAAVNLNPANFITDSGRPYSGYANENLEACELSGAYNSLQVQARHTAGKLNFEANYTWSHTINDFVNFLNTPSDPYDLRKDMGNGDGDIRNNLTGSVTYQFTELKGHNAFMRYALGGWQTSSIVQTRSGAALNPTLTGTFFGLPSRPDVVPGQPRLNKGGKWTGDGVTTPTHYNVAAYAVPANYSGNPGDPTTLGNAPRNSLPGPNFFQWDFSGMKNFAITERMKVQFRADLFNILNHPNFGNPGNMGICASVPSTVPFSSCTAGNATFTTVGQTIADADSTQVGTGTARQIQLSLKVIF